MTDSFGALRPSPVQERFRALARKLPRNYFGRKAASLLLGFAGGRAQRPYDVSVFGSQNARLHPYDNICEKRVYLTPQLWDSQERKILADAISDFGGRSFNFVDVGANVGLYTLFARAEAIRAGAQYKAVCIEADPEMAARLRFNLAASGALEEAILFNCAASDNERMLRFSINALSRGLSRVDAAGETELLARPLLSMISEAGIARIDAMKIDIEGHEHAALCAFFRNAPAELHPAMMMLETSHESEENPAEALVRRAGYNVRLKTARNAILVRGGQ